MLQILAKQTKIVCNTKVWTMTELNMYPTWSIVRINATYTDRIPSGGVSYASFHHFVLLKKYIVYGQGPIACLYFLPLLLLLLPVYQQLHSHVCWHAQASSRFRFWCFSFHTHICCCCCCLSILAFFRCL